MSKKGRKILKRVRRAKRLAQIGDHFEIVYRLLTEEHGIDEGAARRLAVEYIVDVVGGIERFRGGAPEHWVTWLMSDPEQERRRADQAIIMLHSLTKGTDGGISPGGGQRKERPA